MNRTTLKELVHRSEMLCVVDFSDQCELVPCSLSSASAMSLLLKHVESVSLPPSAFATVLSGFSAMLRK